MELRKSNYDLHGEALVISSGADFDVPVLDSAPNSFSGEDEREAQPDADQTQVHLPGEARGVVRVQRVFRWAIAAWGLLVFWNCRFGINPDGVSYLDIGDQYWRGNWHAALNPYWSPLYSWLTGFLMWFTKPSMRWEFQEVHLLNFSILLAALVGFEFFWREVLNWAGAVRWAESSRRYAWIVGYLLFVSAHFIVVPSLLLVTPDLIVDSLVYVIAAMVLRFIAGQMSMRSAAVFGCLLGVGYLAKTAMLPFGFLVLVMMFIAARSTAGKRLVVTALFTFLVVSVPYIASISWNNHRFTYGDSGKMNVAWWINDLPQENHLQEFGPEYATLIHPLRKLLERPELYEFGTPIAGTYPPWYDPTYWNAGIDTHMHLLRMLVRLRRNFVDLSDYLFLKTGFITAVLLLVLVGDSLRRSLRSLLLLSPIVVPAIVMVFIFAMLILEPRYFIAECVTLWGALIASACVAADERRTKILRAACFALVPMVVCLMPARLVEDHNKNEQFKTQILVAEGLRSMGIQPGDQVAIIGDGLEAYWARLERVKIVAEVPGNAGSRDPAKVFWNLPQQRRQAVLDTLRAAGARAVIAEPPSDAPVSGWLGVGKTGSAVYFFR